MVRGRGNLNEKNWGMLGLGSEEEADVEAEEGGGCYGWYYDYG